MKNKIIVSLLLILLLALSASAVSASEDTVDAISETSDTSDIELINEDVADTESISENLDEEDMADNNVNDDTKKLGDNGEVILSNNYSIGSINQLHYINDYPGYNQFLLKDKPFNLTEPFTIEKSCIINGGIIKAENSDCFFKIESPANGGPNSVTIKDTKFLITRNQNVIFANGQLQGINNVLDIPGITLENITLEISDGVSPEDVSLVYINGLPIGNTISNEINLVDNNLNGANNMYIKGVGNVSVDTLEVAEIINPKKTRIILNTNVVRYAVDTAVGDSSFPFQVKLVDENGNSVANKTITFALDDHEALTAKTNADGIATLKLSLSNAKTYNIYSIYTGDDEFLSSDMVANTITINKKVSSLAIKNVSYKVTATKKLTATFKDQNKKLIKNKKVTFTVNGKTYTATTNSKGVATVKITLNKKGTYTYSAKFAGDKTYWQQA